MNKNFEKIASQFADLMVEKIQSLEKDWQKPWFTFPGYSGCGGNINLALPQNLDGRHYEGGNAFLLLFQCEKMGYKTPVFLTAKRAFKEQLNIKGQTSFPVWYMEIVAMHKETKKYIKFNEYRALSEGEREEYKLKFFDKWYNVFNLDQTDFAEKYPARWEKLQAKFKSPEKKEETPATPDASESFYKNSVLDAMLQVQNWVCRIDVQHSDRAFFSPGGDFIMCPLKAQFRDGESFYSTMLHEMSHSTGTAERLNRTFGRFFGDDAYGRVELVAELSAALSGMMMGISTGIRDENAAYIKSWIKNIREEPKFLISTLNDAMKTVKYIFNTLNISFEKQDTQAA